jgi:hypothetical protein
MSDRVIIFSNILDDQVIRKSIQRFSVDNIEFEVIALTRELSGVVGLSSTADEMVYLAAEYGLFYDGERAMDNKVIDLAAALEDIRLQVESGPSVKYQVGKKVCDISGLLPTLENLIESEHFAKIKMEQDEDEAYTESLLRSGMIDGDGTLPDVTIDQLNKDANAAII